MLNSLATTWQTPLKCPGRCLPSSTRAKAGRSTTTSGTPGRYISSGGGLKTRSTPALSHFARSASIGRGYFVKSSCRPELRRVDENAHRDPGRLAGGPTSISDKCPACSAPIVGTSATRPSFFRSARNLRDRSGDDHPYRYRERTDAPQASSLSGRGAAALFSLEEWSCAPAATRARKAFPRSSASTPDARPLAQSPPADATQTSARASADAARPVPLPRMRSP